MIRTDSWQQPTERELQNILSQKPGVIALALFGSALQSITSLDPWSDLDVLLVVRDETFANFYPNTEWLKSFGEIFAYEQSDDAYRGTTRVCFTDFRRLDFVITTEAHIQQLADWPRIPFWQGIRPLFSRSVLATQALSQTWAPPRLVLPSEAEFQGMVHRFWFKSTVAGYKVVRQDLLIALHLALDLVRDCCVLAMLLRDRAEQTNQHREGGLGNQIVDLLKTIQQPYTTAGILNMIEQSAAHFDELASQWSDAYQAHRYPLMDWLRHIREMVISAQDDGL